MESEESPSSSSSILLFTARLFAELFCSFGWEYISLYQKLSKEFIIKYFYILDIQNLLNNYYIDKETKEFIKVFQ